jgi:Ni,Fe-hydrogenase III large subunit
VSSSLLVHRAAVAELRTLEPKAWRDDLRAQLHDGKRVVTLYGMPQPGERVRITAVLQAADRSLRVTRTTVTQQFGYHELTSEFPALHCFERELHEQTGVRIAAHPWLKPIRYEHGVQADMNAYPFYVIEGKEVHEVAVGPIHAGVIEPGSFRFMCLGEQVHHLEIHLGYQHRGVERLLLAGDATKKAPLVETISGDTSVAHAWAYCAAIESLTGCEVELEVEVARAVALELERIAMHLAGLAGLAADIGFLQGATTYGRLRTTAINTTMRMCGSRFGRGALRPGGVTMNVGPDFASELRANLELLRHDLAIIDDCFLSAQTVQHRLRGVGVLTPAQTTSLGLVGMAARSAGVPLDARDAMKDGAYAVLPIPVTVTPDGDCWARAQLRVTELGASLAWVKAMVDRFPDWNRPRKALGAMAKNQLVIAVAEGWRGEVVHCLETGERGELVHYKVQDPSLRNWMGLAQAVRENEISDFPICNKSFDLSYCGNDL